MNEQNKEFLILTFLSNTQSSSFQRGNVYEEDATEDQKRAFQADFRRKLRELEAQYKKQRVSDEDHVKIIRNFADQLSQTHQKVLFKGRLRIGTAQKAVNLFLKFLWSVDLISEPPHCPIDRIVLAEIGDGQKWTKLNNIEAYKKIIATIKLQVGQQTPAQWERDLWNREAQKV